MLVTSVIRSMITTTAARKLLASVALWSYLAAGFTGEINYAGTHIIYMYYSEFDGHHNF